MDMNIDCLLLIFEDMHIFDLLSLTEVNKNLLPVVQDVLRRRFLKKAVIFLCPFDHFTPKYTRTNVEEFSDEIYIKHMSFCTSTLDYFGHLISTLKILHDYKIPQEDAQTIFGSANLYCAESLRELHILNQNDIFAHFKKPFEKVTHVSLDGVFKHFSNSDLAFLEIFPVMQHLTLKDVEFQDSNWLDRRFPHLNHLTTDISANSHVKLAWRFNETAFKRLIQSNPHIRSLNLRFATQKLLQVIAKTLPKLERLELVNFNDESNNTDRSLTMHFEHLKSLRMVDSPVTVPSNITFEDLEEFETNGDSQEWLEIIANRKSLVKLRIERYLNNLEIVELTKKQLNVIEIYLECGSEVLVENLVKLIENCPNLMKFRLHTPWTVLWHSAVDTLYKSFPNWIVSQTQFYIDLKQL